jgi:hypothetical protein
MNRKKLLLTLALPVLVGQGVQAQTGSRLIAQANWHHNGATYVKDDSTAYTYLSGSRGGDLTHQLKYDNATTWIAIDDTTNLNSKNYVQDFYPDNKLKSTVTQSWNGTSGMWDPQTKVIYFYDSTTGQLTSSINETWSGSGWVNASQDLFTYDVSGNVYSDENKTWNTITNAFDPSSILYYFYSGGNLTTLVGKTYSATLMAYDFSYKFDYTYTSGHLTSTTYRLWNSGTSSWVDIYRYTNEYDGSGNRLTNLYAVFSGGNWVPDTLHVYSNFTSSHLPRTEVVQLWSSVDSSWKNQWQFTEAYNSTDQLTATMRMSRNASDLFWELTAGDNRSAYYYGAYSNAGVNNTAASVEANVFPVPAQNMVFVDLKWKEAQAATLSLTDLQGRVIRSWGANGAQSHMSVLVNDLANGVYMIKINAGNDVIVKRVVVAH